MQIDITKIKNSKKGEIKFELSDNLEFFNVHLGELEFKEPVLLKGSIANIDNKFILNANIKTTIQLHCSCCNTLIDRNIDLSISEIFVTSNNTEEDVWVLSGNIIELNPVVISNIALDIPMKILCKENCKGLCPKCGHDLNMSNCNCDMTEIDPRFEKLKELVFDNNEEV